MNSPIFLEKSTKPERWPNINHETCILEVLGCSRRTFNRFRKELIIKGVITVKLMGSPPQKRIISYPHKLVEWQMERGIIVKASTL